MWFDCHLMGNGSYDLVVAVFLMDFYAINNCSNDSFLFEVNFVSGHWSSFIGVFTFLDTPFIYCLCSRWIFQYMLFSIEAELQPLFFPIPPGGIDYVNTIFNFISISCTYSSTVSLTISTVASSAFKLDTSSSSSYSLIWFGLPSPSIPSWWYMGCW